MSIYRKSTFGYGHALSLVNDDEHIFDVYDELWKLATDNGLGGLVSIEIFGDSMGGDNMSLALLDARSKISFSNDSADSVYKTYEMPLEYENDGRFAKFFEVSSDIVRPKNGAVKLIVGGSIS